MARATGSSRKSIGGPPSPVSIEGQSRGSDRGPDTSDVQTAQAWPVRASGHSPPSAQLPDEIMPRQSFIRWYGKCDPVSQHEIDIQPGHLMG